MIMNKLFTLSLIIGASTHASQESIKRVKTQHSFEKELFKSKQESSSSSLASGESQEEPTQIQDDTDHYSDTDIALYCKLGLKNNVFYASAPEWEKHTLFDKESNLISSAQKQHPYTYSGFVNEELAQLHKYDTKLTPAQAREHYFDLAKKHQPNIIAFTKNGISQAKNNVHEQYTTTVKDDIITVVYDKKNNIVYGKKNETFLDDRTAQSLFDTLQEKFHEDEIKQLNKTPFPTPKNKDKNTIGLTSLL